MQERKHNTIIWDLDGTLMDTLQDLYLAVNHSLKHFNLPGRSIEEVRRFVGNGVRKLMLRAVPEGDKYPQFEEIFNEFKSYYIIHCQDNTKLYSGLTETLADLKKQDIKMAIVSNKLQAGVDELYKEFFKDYIDVAIGERQGVPRKPAPDMVEIALKELGSEKQDAVYIGDSDVDVMTAKNSGLTCISVLWGFRDKEFLIEHGATEFAEKPSDVINML